MSNLIDRQTALDAIDAWRREYPLDLQEPIDDCWNSIRELPAAQPDHNADIGKKVSISCGRENDLISRQEALKELAAYIHLIDKTMGKGTLTDDDCMEAAKSVLGEDELPAAQPATNCSEIPNSSDDTISRQAAIDVALEDVSDKRTHEFNAGAIRAVNRIKSLPSAQPEPKWIPCSERMPDNYDYQLLTEEVHYTTGKIVRCVLIAYYDDEDDVWMSAEESPEAISYPIAWMPLPEPYKEEGDT